MTTTPTSKQHHSGAKPSCLLITIEGLDGAGKTTLARGLVRTLKSHHYQVYLVNGVDYALSGDKTKQAYYLLPRQQKQQFWVNSFVKLEGELVAKFAKQLQHPPVIIICDRWYDSTVVYQGRQDGWKLMLQQRVTVASQLSPQIKFLIKTPLSLVRERWLAKGNHNWRADVFTMFWELYQKVMGSDAATILLPGEKSIANLVQLAQHHVANYVQKHWSK